MKKILIGVLIILVLTGVGAGGYFYYEKNIQNPLTKNKIIKNEINEIHNIKAETELTADEKVDILKKRFSLRGTIMKGDSFYDNNQMLLALNEYLKAFKESPNDNQIIKKIALVYFDLKKFSQSFKYYEKIESTLNDEEKEKMMLSLVYEVDLQNKTNIKETSEKIKNLNVSKDEKVYYINTINCTLNFHDCKKIFGDYTKANTGVTFNKLLNIKNALDNYENFKSENLYYKDALLIGALFQDKLYNISNYLGEDLLKNYPSYKPILLTTGKGYYELGKIKEARDYLTKYYELDQSNVNLTYLLGDINFKLRDYVGSNIYYNNALQNGFEPKIDAQRKLIYNYFLLNDKRGMLKMFGFLLDQSDSNINDFSLGIYHAILEGREEEAIQWSERGLQKFKDKTGFEIFYGYLAWIQRENKNLDVAENYITEGLKINPRNPLLTLNYGYLEEFRGNYTKALIHFKRTIVVNGEGEFGELAEKEVELIEKFLKETNQSLISTGNTTNSGIVNINNIENK